MLLAFVTVCTLWGEHACLAETPEEATTIGRKLDAEDAKLAPEQPNAAGTVYVGASSDRLHDAPVRTLFDAGRAFSTVMIWVAFMTGLFMVYALNSWLTKLMAMAGYSLGSALNFVIVFNVGAIVGAIGGGLLSDKFNIKHVLVAFYVVGAASLAALAYTKSTELLFVAVFVVGASTLGTQLLAYAYAGARTGAIPGLTTQSATPSMVGALGP
jgi:AAHS family benzoate transporter-like MFS transporter